MDDTRCHDGSSYERGFEAGWFHRPHHLPPLNPHAKSSQRQAARWNAGFLAGVEAAKERAKILGSRARMGSEKAAAAFRRMAAEKQARATERTPSPDSDNDPSPRAESASTTPRT